MPTLAVLEKIIAIINIIIYISVVIVALNTVWRVEEKLDKFLKILAIAIALVPLRLMIEVAGFNTDPLWMIVTRILGFLVGVMLLVAFIGLLKTVKKLNNEK